MPSPLTGTQPRLPGSCRLCSVSDVSRVDCKSHQLLLFVELNSQQELALSVAKRTCTRSFDHKGSQQDLKICFSSVFLLVCVSRRTSRFQEPFYVAATRLNVRVEGTLLCDGKSRDPRVGPSRDRDSRNTLGSAANPRHKPNCARSRRHVVGCSHHASTSSSLRVRALPVMCRHMVCMTRL